MYVCFSFLKIKKQVDDDSLLIVLIKYGAAHPYLFHCKEAKKETEHGPCKRTYGCFLICFCLLQSVSTQKAWHLLGQSYLASFGKHKVMRLRKGAKFPMAAISEDLIKTTLIVHAEKLVQFKVRVVVTMRNKMKEDFKETILKHFDAINNRIGTRNIVLDADYQHQD